MPVSKAQQASVNKYVKSNYDRINVTMPKGQKEVIQSAAAAVGESANSYINTAIIQRMERDTLPKEVVFGRAVDVIAEHYEVSPWDVLDELKGLDETESPSEAAESALGVGTVTLPSEAVKTAQRAAEGGNEHGTTGRK